MLVKSLLNRFFKSRYSEPTEPEKPTENPQYKFYNGRFYSESQFESMKRQMIPVIVHEELANPKIRAQRKKALQFFKDNPDTPGIDMETIQKILSCKKDIDFDRTKRDAATIIRLTDKLKASIKLS